MEPDLMIVVVKRRSPAAGGNLMFDWIFDKSLAGDNPSWNHFREQMEAMDDIHTITLDGQYHSRRMTVVLKASVATTTDALHVAEEIARVLRKKFRPGEIRLVIMHSSAQEEMEIYHQTLLQDKIEPSHS